MVGLPSRPAKASFESAGAGEPMTGGSATSRTLGILKDESSCWKVIV